MAARGARAAGPGTDAAAREPDFTAAGEPATDGAGADPETADRAGVAPVVGGAGVEAAGTGEPGVADGTGAEARGGLRPTTRTAVQVVVAGALSILVGGLVSPGQWFWAVITAFVVFAGAASRGELLVRAGSRTAGTLFGVIAGVVVASVLAGHPVMQGAVVLLCVFLAFYLLPVSYGLMTFFITTMLGVLYGLLGRFSVAFLEIRLVETVIGAVAGSLAALVVLPTRTRSVVADNLTALCESIAELLRGAAAELRDGAGPGDLAAEARTVDDRMHALLASANPLVSFRLGDARARSDRWRQLIGSVAAAGRELVRSTPLAAVTTDADTRARLGGLAETVAGLADALAERELTAAAALVDRAIAEQGVLVDLVEALQTGPTALRTVLHQLGRMRGALADIADELGAARPTGRPSAPASPSAPPGAHQLGSDSSAVPARSTPGEE